MYIIRLDDASEYMNIEKWTRIEELLDKYNIKPIVGIIPDNQDTSLVNEYKVDSKFWNKARLWQSKKWIIALHGFTHVCSSNSGGLNPVNLCSEFAGVKLEEQKVKITSGLKILKEHGLDAKIFFAPSHTFDISTLEALFLVSDIRIISDTIANDIYKMGNFYFIPQQAGVVKKLPFKTTTFCYHPNTMSGQEFAELERFILKYKIKFGTFEHLVFKDRNFNLYDGLLRKMYFFIRKIRNKLIGR